MKATERGEGGLHRSQLRSAGQSEEAASAYRTSQVAEDHQDIGKIPLQWPPRGREGSSCSCYDLMSVVVETLEFSVLAVFNSCLSFLHSKEQMFDSARCWRYCNPHRHMPVYHWLQRSNVIPRHALIRKNKSRRSTGTYEIYLTWVMLH